ncbi:beta-1,3-galactosyltransferase brn-like [Mizuhopecten yessoensis]|uniref:Hexosyltransferase n=1 Tax=Mizuhopecten yessoensis TaxID=6573 RepID=A0A210PKC8_MIZYE|nr:beta-1,3-galactosyltransferase brn-like [Mizuhopecten yessoensis]OWF36933.1 Beta-1,3-galactosyltransferase brn [Mizuhopecten yessoensis]
MKNQHYLVWICRRFKNIFMCLLLLFSIFSVLTFFHDSTLSRSYNKMMRVSFNKANRSTNVIKTRNNTVLKITNKPLVHTNVVNKTSHRRGRKVPPMSRFRYPLYIELADIVNRKILNNTPIDIQPINPHNFQYLHKPEKCKFPGSGDTLNMLVLVKSAAKNKELRLAIRDTWAKDALPNIRVVFLLAGTDQPHQTQIDEESKKYSDVIQEDFIDVYKNNTYKTIMGFNWGVTYCPSASFFFFVDDDHYAILSTIYNYLLSFRDANSVSLLSGYLLPHSQPFRDIKSKWFVSWEDYGFDWWPPYLAGGAYLVSFSVARKFQIAFPYVKYLGIDDSYLGIVAKKLNIRPTHNNHFGNRISFANFKRSNRSSMFASHGFKDPNKMRAVWKTLHANDTNSTRKL